MKNLLVYGLQRSGTTYLEKLLTLNFRKLALKNNAYVRSLPLHKHFRLYDEKYLVPEPKYLNNFHYSSFSDFDAHVKRIAKLEESGYIVITKEPYSWYISYCRLAKKTGWKTYMKKWINNHYVLEYNLFCRKWLDFQNEAPDKVLLIRYEDLLNDFDKVLDGIRDNFGLTKAQEFYNNLDKVPMSKKFSLKRRNYYKEGRFTDQFNDDELLVLSENLDQSVVEELGYKIVRR